MQQRLCREHNANIHRAVHTLSYEATEAYEAGRKAAQRFLNAASPDEIVMTSGATPMISPTAAAAKGTAAISPRAFRAASSRTVPETAVRIMDPYSSL